MNGEIEAIWYIQQSLTSNATLLNMRGFQTSPRDHSKNACDPTNIVTGHGIQKKYKKNIYILGVKNFF